jgi:hypothetical protein
VLVALTLGAMLVLAAHGAFGGASDAAAALARAQAAHDAEFAGRAALARLVANLDPASPGSTGFDGGPDGMRFSARVRSHDGHLSLRAVRLSVTGDTLRATSQDGPLAALPHVRAVACDYLLEGGADARWVTGWHSPVSAPLAVRIRLIRADGAADTLLLPIGPRG